MIFNSNEDFNKWALSLSKDKLDLVYKIRFDEGKEKYLYGISIYPSCDNLVLLTPFEIKRVKENEYDTFYPQIEPIKWNKLEILEELTELDAIKEMTGNLNAILYEYEYTTSDNN